MDMSNLNANVFNSLTRSIQNASTFISRAFRQQKLSRGIVAGWRSVIAIFKFFKKWFLHRFMYLDLPCLLVPDLPCLLVPDW